MAVTAFNANPSLANFALMISPFTSAEETHFNHGAPDSFPEA